MKFILALLICCNGIIAAEGYREGKNIRYLDIESYADVQMYNWAQNVQFRPEMLFYPKNKVELQKIVRSANERGKKISIVGKGHSWNPLMEGTDYVISTLAMKKIEVHPEANEVTVESGATIKEVDEELKKYNLMVPCNIVGTTDITYGGIMATGSHGSGVNCQTMSDTIVSLEMITPQGEIEVFSEKSHGREMMSALKVNLGLFGVMYKIRFKVSPSFNVVLSDKSYPLEDLFKVLPKYLSENENVEVLWFPFTKNVVIKSWIRTDEKITPVTLWQKIEKKVKSEALYFLFKHFISGLFTDKPFSIPYINRLVAPKIFPDSKKVVDATTAIHYVNEGTRYPINETELAIPFKGQNIKDVKKGWNAMVAAVQNNEKKGLYPLNVVVHMRFIAGSDAMMSPSFQNEKTCYMDFGSFHKTQGWKDLVNEVWQTWKTIPGGKLHWAKDMIAYDYLDISSMYGEENVSTFLRLQKQSDPKGIFLNDFMRNLFNL